MTIKQSSKFPEVVQTKKSPEASSLSNLDKPLDISEIKSENAVLLRSVQQSVKRKVQNVRKNSAKYGMVEIDEVISGIDVEIKKYKSLEHVGSKVGMNGRQLLAQLADLNVSVSGDDGEVLRSMAADLQAVLPLVLDRELYHWFLSEMLRFKADLLALKEEARGAEHAFRKEKNELGIRERVAQMKGYDDISALRGDLIKSVEMGSNVDKAVRELLFHPFWFSRKFEKLFSVILEKVENTITISGCARDVDACVVRLETLDLAGNKTLFLDGRALAMILGPGGCNVGEIEAESSVLIYCPPGSVELCLFGSEAAVAKAVKKFGDIKELQSGSAGIVSERIVCLLCEARLVPTDRIEEECGVTIVRGESLVVRGPHESVGRAVNAITAFIAQMSVQHLDIPETLIPGLNLLLGGGAASGTGQIKLLVRFADLKKRAAIVRTGDATVDVATTVGEDVVDEFLYILQQACYETKTLTLEQHHWRVWNDQMCQLVGSVCKEVFSFKRPDLLEIWGPEIERAQSLVKEVHCATILTVPEACIRPMLDNKCQILQSIQSEAGVACHFDRFENSLFLYGLAVGKQKGAAQFAEFIDSINQAVLQSSIKTIPIAADEIGRLIGPKGRTMNAIREKSGIEEIRISESEKCVYLVGSSLGIDHAITLIEEELGARKDSTIAQIGLAENEENTRELLAQIDGTKTQTTNPGLMGNRQDQWTAAPAVQTSQTPVALDSTELFPALGMATKTKKR